MEIDTVNNNENLLKEICLFLINDNFENKILEVITKIETYLSSSKISHDYHIVTEWIYTLSEEPEQTDNKTDRVNQNCLKLKDYAIDKGLNIEIIDFISHFYSHLKLAIMQQTKFKKAKEELKNFNEQTELIKEKIKKSETNTITVLGIFSAIIVSITGIFSFSSNVLANLKDLNFYGLFAVAYILLAIFGILDFLYSIINEKENPFKRLVTLIPVLLSIFIVAYLVLNRNKTFFIMKPIF